MTALHSTRLAAFRLGLAPFLLAPAAAEETVRIRDSALGLEWRELIAIEKGYFPGGRYQGRDRRPRPSAIRWRCSRPTGCRSSPAASTAGYFNAIEKDLPIIFIADRVSTPIGHSLIVAARSQDKITSLASSKER